MKTWGSRGIARGMAACLAAALVAGCGGSGGSGDGTATLRVVNASTGYGLLDFYVDSSLSLSSIASNTASTYISLSTASHNTAFERTGSTTVLQSQDRTLANNVSYTLVAYGWEGALKTFQLSEDQAAPASGSALIRTVNTAADAGTLDVYVTGTTDSLTDVSPVNTVAANSLSSYATVTQGTYRIRVTASGDKTDVRLDIPSVTLSNQDVASLVVTPTTGGVLVNALLIEQKGNVSSFANTYGRARLVAATSGNASVDATMGSTTLSATGGSRSPLVGSYTLVPTGLLPLSVSVNGSAVSAGSATVSPGADLTLLVYGDPAAAQTAVLADDNRLPSTQSGNGKSKVRLVHAVSGLNSGLSLVADYSDLADNIAYGSASSYVTLDSGTLSEIDVTSPLQASALFSATNVTLQTDGIYTVFMMGGSSAPAGVLRRDR